MAHKTLRIVAALAIPGSVVVVAPRPLVQPARAQGPIGYAAPVLVDPVRAGGEPLVIYSSKGNDLIYSSHEGTTHLDRSGAPGLDSVAGFFCPGALQPMVQQSCYSNHVWIWTSDDHGKSWTFRDEGPQYSGFSDPDLTTDAAGNVYDTGINLANDALFSSPDGGKTWPTGTTNCHDGDRPWLAGGRANEVFLETDGNGVDDAGNHILAYSNNAGASCSSTIIADAGSLPDGTTFSGFGKGVYDPADGSFIEPAHFIHKDGSFGVGISRLPNAAHAFSGGSETFQPLEVVTHTSVQSPFGAPNVLRIDSQQNLYFAWDTNDRQANSSGGCNNTVPNQSGPVGQFGAAGTPVPNHIMFEAGKHTGPGQWQWSQPIALESYGPARLPGKWVEWPWSAVGTPGNVSVVWYQLDTLMDPDCDGMNGQSFPNAKTYIFEAHITNALNASAVNVTVTNASGREVHQGGICNSGTTCAATGQDRRLGDYFANDVDAAGCVMIASGDTTTKDALTGQERITSLPIFIQQTSGPSLTGQDCAAATAVKKSGSNSGMGNTGGGPPVAAPGLLVILLGGMLAASVVRRRA